jgi:hypothetical protein
MAGELRPVVGYRRTVCAGSAAFALTGEFFNHALPLYRRDYGGIEY